MQDWKDISVDWKDISCRVPGGLVPSTCMTAYNLTTFCNQMYRASGAFFWHPQTPEVHVEHIHSGKALKHTIKFNESLKSCHGDLGLCVSVSVSIYLSVILFISLSLSLSLSLSPLFHFLSLCLPTQTSSKAYFKSQHLGGGGKSILGCRLDTISIYRKTLS